MYNGNDEKMCEWVGDKADKRCVKNRNEAAFACPATCNPDCPEPSEAPSSIPSVAYTDNLDYMYSGNDKKTCEWVGENAENRCSQNGNEAVFECPATVHGRQTSLKSVVQRATMKYSTHVQMHVILLAMHHNLLQNSSLSLVQ
jgi:hypothetical protein